MALMMETKGAKNKILEVFLFIQMTKSSKFSEKLELVIYHHLPDFLRKWLLKTFPAVTSRVFIFVMDGPSQKALDVKWPQF